MVTLHVVAAILWLSGLASATLRLGKPAPSSSLSSSSSHRFPQDIYAQPAFKVTIDQQATVDNATVQQLLTRSDAVSLPDSVSPQAPHMIMHSSPSISHLCTLSQPPLRNKQPSQDNFTLTPSNLLSERHRVIRSGLALLAPLKGKCLYHTSDWFTYSLCFGEAIRQFRAIPSTIGHGKVPAQDPSQHAFVLGRWRDDLEVVGGQPFHRFDGQDESLSERQLSALATTSTQRLSDLIDMQDDDNGTELMEIISFSHDGADDDEDAPQRYLSQTWSDGTLCDINNEPRSVDVQYHCNPGLPPSQSQITLIKETTTCHYVLVVETSLTCKEHHLRNGHAASGPGSTGGASQQQRQSKVGEWKCKRIIHDSASTTSGGEHAETPSGDEDAPADASITHEEPLHQDEAEDTPGDALPQDSTPPAADAAGKYVALSLDDEGNVVVNVIGEEEAGVLSTMQEQDIEAGAETDRAHGLLERLLRGDGGVIGGPIEIQLNERDLRELLDGNADADDALQSAITRMIEKKVKKEDDKDGDSDDNSDEPTSTPGIQRLESRLSSVTDALLQARVDAGDGGAANERDGSSTIFSELNKAARHPDEAEQKSHDDKMQHKDKEPTLSEKIMEQVAAHRQRQSEGQQGEGQVENTAQGAMVNGQVRGPTLGGGKKPSSPTFHGPGGAKKDHDKQGHQQMESFADRAQRFYDGKQKAKDEKESHKKKDEL